MTTPAPNHLLNLTRSREKVRERASPFRPTRLGFPCVFVVSARVGFRSLLVALSFNARERNSRAQFAHVFFGSARALIHFFYVIALCICPQAALTRHVSLTKMSVQ